MGKAYEVASKFQGLFKDIVDLGPFVTKSVLLQSFHAYADTLGLKVKDEEWYRKQVYDLRQILSHIRIKAVRVNTQEQGNLLVPKICSTFSRIGVF